MKDTLLDLLEDLLMTIYLPLVLLLGVWGLMLAVWCGRVYSAPNRLAYIVWSLRNNGITNRLFRRWLYYQCPVCGGLFTGLVESERDGAMCSTCQLTKQRRDEVLALVHKAQSQITQKTASDDEEGWTVKDVMIFFALLVLFIYCGLSFFLVG